MFNKCWLLFKKILYANIKESTTKNHSSYGQDVVKGTEFTLLLETSKFKKKERKKRKQQKHVKKTFGGTKHQIKKDSDP